MNFNVSYSMFFVLMLLAGFATYFFFRGRKLNLQLIIHYTRELEKVFMPVDKNYTIISLYVGFKAMYKVDKLFVRKVEITLALLPRHSFFYFPISLLTSKFDRLYFGMRMSRIDFEEAHVVDPKWLRHSGIEDEKLKILTNEKIQIKGKEFVLLYMNNESKERLLEILDLFPEVNLIKHLCFVPETSYYFMLISPKPEKVKEYAEAYYKGSELLVKTSSS